MPSLTLKSRLNIPMVANVTNLPVVPSIARARARTHVRFDVTLIPKTGHQRKVFGHMPSTAGVQRSWKNRRRPRILHQQGMHSRRRTCVMDQLRLYLNERAKERLRTHIDPTPRMRLGTFVYLNTCGTCLTSDSCEIVKWVAQSMRPFSIVEDEGFKTLMKTGRPNHYIPKRRTVARDVRYVFKKTKKRIAKILRVSVILPKNDIDLTQTYQEHQGALSFATDAWTSPNHTPYVAITVHMEEKGVPVSLLLDIVRVACSHSGINLAKAFVQVLEEFGIADKVSVILEV